MVISLLGCGGNLGLRKAESHQVGRRHHHVQGAPKEGRDEGLRQGRQEPGLGDQEAHHAQVELEGQPEGQVVMPRTTYNVDA